ncbi:hypothetical protein KX816_01620 [Sphingosinicellaceae bacterium]|nr:hypothetical protein KX816_01620 [Sphingosinicellaceae bacterium]
MTGIAAIFAATVPCAVLAAKVPARQSSRAATMPLRATMNADSDRLRAAGLTPFSPPLIDSARFTFTAPGRGASTARLDTVDRAFRFTPSGQSARRAVTLGVTSRVVAASTDASRVVPVESFAVAPAAYNVGMSVAWHGFAVSGGYSRIDSPVTALGPNRREAVDAGLSYHGRNWKTAFQVAAETGSPLLLSPLERRYSVDLGGAYSLRPGVSLSGGVRYKLAPVSPSLVDTDSADKSVYLGTAVSF